MLAFAPDGTRTHSFRGRTKERPLALKSLAVEQTPVSLDGYTRSS